MKSIGETLIFGFKNPEVRYWKELKECQPGNHNRTISFTHIKNSRIYGRAAQDRAPIYLYGEHMIPI